MDWAHPPLRCIEEMVPAEPENCPDFREMGDPRDGFPKSISKEGRAWWGKHKGELAVCRARELIRRASKNPGYLSEGQTEWQLMLARGSEKREEKIDAIYDAGDRRGVPPHVLAGALFQESRMADLPVTEDGGNYSCGIGQMNLIEWCRFSESLSFEEQARLEWPREGLQAYLNKRGEESACDTLARLEISKGFYEAAKERFGGSPHLYTPERYAKLSESDVSSRFPGSGSEAQKLRFRMGRSFFLHCSDTDMGIEAKAHALRWLYVSKVPRALRQIQQYPDGESYPATGCKRVPRTKAYPFHAGWLLADAAYNAGANVVDLVSYYLRSPKNWAPLTPPLLIESIFMGGDFNTISGKIGFTGMSGRSMSIPWEAVCIAQRHIAHVIQEGLTREGARKIHSLEGEDGCGSGSFFGIFGKGVPKERSDSSGRISISRFKNLEKNLDFTP